jgi:hypothetical protein
MQVARVAVKLETILQTMKRLHGDKWDEMAAPYRAVLNGVVGTEGCSVLDAALPIAKAMSEAGESPLMLIAVAAEMCNANAPANVATVVRHCSACGGTGYIRRNTFSGSALAYLPPRLRDIDPNDKNHVTEKCPACLGR